MNKTIIFDLNGVFIVTPRLSDRFLNDFGVSIDEFMPALSEIMDKVRLPDAVSSYSLWAPYLKKWGIGFSENEFLDYWFSAEVKANEELVEIARKLKNKGYKLIIMSNNFRERAEYYAKTFKFMGELFEKVYYSWQTGFVKPDARAFQQIFTDFNLQPSDCIYFDDSDKNIQLAESLGIESYIFDENATEYLRKLAGQSNL